jgi:membrane protease YdiL (CAAX protease family)
LRLARPLAWGILLLGLLTAGLLRQFHEGTPSSPYIHPVVGSLLFAAVFFLLLVAAREWNRGAVPGRGVRLGSLTPILLMLLIEKWTSLTLYVPLFDWLDSASRSADLSDARFRLFAGVGLLLVCLLVARFSAPTARKTWRRGRPSRWPAAALATLLSVGGTYVLLAGVAALGGGGLRLQLPPMTSLLVWTLVGQAVLAFAEELYYRGLLLSEMERLAPRLGAANPALRRWTALLSTAVVFGLEHIDAQAPTGELTRQLVFSVSLALLFGLLVMASANLHVAAGMHAWINWLLLGSAPYFVDGSGEPALPAGTYIGVSMVLAFVLAYALRRLRLGRRS